MTDKIIDKGYEARDENALDRTERDHQLLDLKTTAFHYVPSIGRFSN